jgi:hypothetical protein
MEEKMLDKNLNEAPVLTFTLPDEDEPGELEDWIYLRDVYRRHRELVGAEEIVDPRPKIRIQFKYPGSPTENVTFTSARGFTRSRFARCVATTFRQRMKVYPMYGHTFTEVALEGAHRDEDVWHLDIGT